MQDKKIISKKNYTAIRILIKANELIRCEQLYKNILQQLPIGMKATCVYLPKEVYTISLPASPHGYGAHRNTFGFDTYKLCINIGSSTKLTSDVFKELLTSIHNAKAIPGVNIKIICKPDAIISATK